MVDVRVDHKNPKEAWATFGAAIQQFAIDSYKAPFYADPTD